MNKEGIKVSARPILVLTCFYFASWSRVYIHVHTYLDYFSYSTLLRPKLVYLFFQFENKFKNFVVKFNNKTSKNSTIATLLNNWKPKKVCLTSLNFGWFRRKGGIYIYILMMQFFRYHLIILCVKIEVLPKSCQQVKEDNLPPHWGSNSRISVCEANAIQDRNKSHYTILIRAN